MWKASICSNSSKLFTTNPVPSSSSKQQAKELLLLNQNFRNKKRRSVALQNHYCWFCMEGIHKFWERIIIKQILHGLTSIPDYKKKKGNIWNTQELLLSPSFASNARQPMLCLHQVHSCEQGQKISHDKWLQWFSKPPPAIKWRPRTCSFNSIWLLF